MEKGGVSRYFSKVSGVRSRFDFPEFKFPDVGRCVQPPDAVFQRKHTTLSYRYKVVNYMCNGPLTRQLSSETHCAPKRVSAPKDQRT